MTCELIDLHSHILPGLDDGPATMAETGNMIEWYSAHGITTIVATPHLQSSSTTQWWEQHRLALQAVQALAAPLGIRIATGAEVRLNPESTVDDVRPIEGTRYVLVDFPSGAWPFYGEEVLFRLQLMGYIPILAHPERYGWTTPDIQLARKLVSRGVVLQVTLASFTGHFGRAVRKTAIELLEAGLVHVLATDAHGAQGRLATVENAMVWIRKEYGGAVAANLLHSNPSKILLNVDIEPVTVSNRPSRRIAHLIPGRRYRHED